MPQLHPFQKAGSRWLTERNRTALGDEPGLGKTPQAIDAAEYFTANRVVIVCPGFLRKQWAAEIDKFSTVKRRVNVVTEAKGFEVGDAEFVIVSYDLVTRRKVLSALIAWKPQGLICDEAHFLRNPEAKRTIAVLGHRCTGDKALAGACERVWFLSGGFAPNSVLDYYPILRACGTYSGTFIEFRRRYTVGYEGEHGYVVTRNKDVADLKRRLAKTILRRTHAQVRTELPPVRVVNMVVEPAESPAADEFILRRLPDIDRELSEELAEFARTGRFRHPNNVAAMRRELSMTKVLPMCQLIDEELRGDPTTKALVFGIHSVGLKFIRAFLSHHGAKLLYGGTPQHKRDLFVDEFQTSPRCRVIVANNAVAGLGLNLTAANRVWIFEASWLPDDNDQLIRRAARIGQVRPVLARYVSVADTVDDIVNRGLVKRSSLLEPFRS